MKHMRHCCARGAQLPQTKLTPAAVREIRAAEKRRERLRAQARELTNEALAIKFGVHRRTIEKLLRMETHYHVR